MDFSKYQNLHTLAMLKEVIRKWWHCELSFANGTAVALGAQKELHEKFKTSQPYHLSSRMVAVPLHVGGEYQGYLFVDGFSTEPAPKTDSRKSFPESERATLSPPEIEKLTDLLRFAAQDIASYEDALGAKDRTIQNLSNELTQQYKFEHIVGNSGVMQEVFRMLEKISASESTVLINGESGTGKELVARAIHYNGLRKDKPFVAQNCSALNDNLLESALFGHVKGSFTGAIKDSKGLFETANGGTFFLDEIGDMSTALQLKLLRVLQEGTFTPVGGTTTKQVDVRVLAATHKDLSLLAKKGLFREDLFYRINVIRIQVPPLRHRKDDIPLLVEHFIRKHRRGNRPKGISPVALSILMDYAWPGNIRELENEIERLLVLGSDQDLLSPELISLRIREGNRAGSPSLEPLSASMAPANAATLNEAVELLERDMISRGLQRTGNNKSQLARELGISRSNLILKIQKYGLGTAGALDSD